MLLDMAGLLLLTEFLAVTETVTSETLEQGRIQRLKKEGAHIEWGWPMRRAQRADFFLCERITIDSVHILSMV